jgi:hypothetical protein
VLDGELVIWDPQTERLDFTALQHRLASANRAARLARERPASLVIFDLPVDAGVPLVGHPLRERRVALERLSPLLSPPLQLTPATLEPEVAAAWLRDHAAADVGIEGLVIKGLGQIYRPGVRSWLKLRTRTSTEAVVGAVTGSRAEPLRLILGRPAADGRLRVAGATVTLRAAQRTDIALEAGVPLKVVSEQLGHGALATTADTYTSVDADVAAAAAEAVADIVPRGSRDQPVASQPTAALPVRCQSGQKEAAARADTPAAAKKVQVREGNVGAPSGTRTPNPLIKSQLLCQLS